MQVKVIGFYGAYPEAERATSSYLIKKNGFSCLLDCGSGALSRLQKYMKVTDLDAIVLSHYHHDHMADIGPLQYAFLVQNQLLGRVEKFPIYAHTDNQEAFQKLHHVSTRGVAYDPKENLNVGPFTFSFFKTIHPVPCYGMRITDGEDVVVYTADTSFFGGLSSHCKNADLLIADCSFYEGMDGSGPGHMTSAECGKIAKEGNVKELWLSHLPHFGDISQLKAEAKKYYDGSIQIAYEGLVNGQ